MRMYGSVTCSYCARQRTYFGDAVEQIHEIECDPRNKNAQSELCIAKNIEHTTTWILEDSDGKDVKRLESGVKTLEELSEVSGCELVQDNQLL